MDHQNPRVGVQIGVKRPCLALAPLLCTKFALQTHGFLEYEIGLRNERPILARRVRRLPDVPGFVNM